MSASQETLTSTKDIYNNSAASTIISFISARSIGEVFYQMNSQRWSKALQKLSLAFLKSSTMMIQLHFMNFLKIMEHTIFIMQHLERSLDRFFKLVMPPLISFKKNTDMMLSGLV